MKTILKWIGIAVAVVVAFFILFLIYAMITEYRPKDVDVVYSGAKALPMTKDTLTVVTWNTGYAGLGQNMDFFYDGGERVQDSRENTDKNLAAIVAKLKSYDADIILLQEVDRDAKRTYGENQAEVYEEAFSNYFCSYAPNYKARFVPIPVFDPIGRVDAGLMILSRFEPLQVLRYQYPGGFAFPVRLFNLKRCMLSALYRTKNNNYFSICNTHNSAYDDGSMRRQEMEYVKNMLIELYAGGTLSLTAGDWNQTPPSYKPDQKVVTPAFSPIPMDSTLVAEGWKIYYDPTLPTMRFLHESYKKGSTPTSVIDFFMASPRVECLSVRTDDLNFANSDHNPVIGKFVIH